MFVEQECRARCAYPNEYEIQECSEEHDRECAVCDMTMCDPVLEFVDEERGCNFAGNPCLPCTNKPEGESSRYVIAALGPNSCTWICNEGFYSPIGESVCEECTKFNSTSCPAGVVFSPCSDFLHRDASCDAECDPIEHGKPVENSVWALATVDENWKVVENTGQNEGPNMACVWKCADGYKKETLFESEDLDEDMIQICVPDVGSE